MERCVPVTSSQLISYVFFLQSITGGKPVFLTSDNYSTPICNLTSLNELRNSLNQTCVNGTAYSPFNSLRCKMGANTTNLALRAISRVMDAPGIQSTVAWASCKTYVRSFLNNTTTNSTVVSNTTRCWAEPGSTEYATDPCCNVEYVPPLLVICADLGTL